MLLLDVNAALAEYAGDTAAQYDLFRFSACLQGIVNREKPSLFLDWQEHDRFWLDYCRGPGKFLEREPVDTVSSFRELLVREADRIRALGLIVWDDGVPSTLNAATTVCGTEGFLPVRRNSRARRRVDGRGNRRRRAQGDKRRRGARDRRGRHARSSSYQTD